jgi:hypothetical protein
MILNIKSKTSSWLWFLGVSLLPFILVNGTYSLLELLVPALVEVRDWENVSACVFLANIFLVAYALQKSVFKSWLRLTLGIPALLIMIISAITMTSHWACGEERATHIGEKLPPPELHASCSR